MRNNMGKEHNWLGIRLRGTTANADAIGARISWSEGGVTRTRLKNNGGSYLSSHDPRDVLGIGTNQQFDWLEIQWPAPSRRVDRFTDLPLNRYMTIVEGQGIVATKP